MYNFSGLVPSGTSQTLQDHPIMHSIMASLSLGNDFIYYVKILVGYAFP
jgi:hypothetical protein